MDEWREVKLGEVINFKNGYAFKSKDFIESGIPVIKIKNVKPNQINLYGLNYVSDIIVKDKEKYFIKSDDILITMSGNRIDGSPESWVGKVAKFKLAGKYLLNQRVSIIQAKKEIVNTDYLAYNLSSWETQVYLINQSNSSGGQANISPDIIKDMDIIIPPLEEQKVIAEILSSLDDKIDLLHRQNKTLEELAQTLFRQWFIEEAKDEWGVGKLPDEFDFTMGLSPKGETFNEDKVGTPMYQGNADFEFRFPKNRVYTTDPKRYAEKFDTLISVRAPVGAQNMAKEKCCIGRGVATFKYKADNSFYTYTYFKMRSLMDEIKQFNDSGTVFGSINKTDFQAMEVIIPPNNLVVKYQNEVKPLDDKVIQNTFQIKTLENMRDTLLPKLMSGEVRVKYETIS